MFFKCNFMLRRTLCFYKCNFMLRRTLCFSNITSCITEFCFCKWNFMPRLNLCFGKRNFMHSRTLCCYKFIYAKNAFLFLPVQLKLDHFYVKCESLDLLLQFVRELRYREPQIIELKIISPKSLKHSTLY